MWQTSGTIGRDLWKMWQTSGSGSLVTIKVWQTSGSGKLVAKNMWQTSGSGRPFLKNRGKLVLWQTSGKAAHAALFRGIKKSACPMKILIKCWNWCLMKSRKITFPGPELRRRYLTSWFYINQLWYLSSS